MVSIADRFDKNAYTARGVLPAVATALVSSTVYIDAIILINDSAGAVTVTITDRATDNNGGAWSILPLGLSIAAHSIAVYEFPKLEATGGISWSASSGNAVIGRVIGVK